MSETFPRVSDRRIRRGRGTVSKGRRLKLGTGLLLLCGFCLSNDGDAQPGPVPFPQRNRIGDLQDLTDADDATRRERLERAYVERTVHGASRDTRLSRQMTDVRFAEKNEDWDKVFELTQFWLEGPQRAQIVIDPDTKNFRVLGDYARSVRDRVPAAARARFRQITADETKKLWQRFRSTGRPEHARELIDLYPHSAEAEQALVTLAIRAWDRGGFTEVGLLLDRLAESEARSGLYTNRLQLRHAVAWQRAGQKSLALAVLGDLANTSVEIAGESNTGAEWLSLAASGESETWTEENYDRTIAAAAGVRSSESLTLGLEAAWQTPLFENSSLANRFLASYTDEMHAHDRITATVMEPLVVDDRIIVPTFGSVRCFDRKTGRKLWSYRSPHFRPDVWQKVFQTEISNSRMRLQFENLVDILLVGNDLWSQAATDGQALFVVEPHPIESLNFYGSRRRNPLPPRANVAGGRLVALPLAPDDADDPQPLWTRGGSADANDPLAGHLFVGVPYVRGGLLFTATWKDDLISVHALSTLDGSLLWSRPLIDPSETLQRQVLQQTRGMQFVSSGRTLLCDSPHGILGAVDLRTGQPLWFAPVQSSSEILNGGGNSTLLLVQVGSSGLTRRPLVHDGTVYVMPRSSTWIQARDLETGRLRWEVPRREPRGDLFLGSSNEVPAGDEYLAAVTDDAVFLVGANVCRALDPTSGEELWTVPTRLPTGRGCLVGSVYHLPTVDGIIQAIDLKTGTLDDRRQLASELHLDRSIPEGDESRNVGPLETRLGNLVPVPEGIVSVSARQIAFYPELATMRRSVGERLAKSTGDDSRTAAQQALWTARLLQTDAAENGGDRELLAELNTELERIDQQQARTRRERRRWTERFFGRVAASALETLPLEKRAEQGAEWLARLEATEERQALQLAILRGYCQAGAIEEAIPLAEAILSRSMRSVLLPVAGDDRLRRGYPAAIRTLMVECVERCGDDRATAVLSGLFDESLAEGDPGRLSHLLTMFPTEPQSARVRQRLASLQRDRGRLQHAELLWLANAQHSDPVIRATANCELVRLWDTHGFGAEAAVLRERLLEESGDLSLADGGTVAQRLAFDRLTDITRMAIQQRQPIEAFTALEHRFDLGTPFLDITPETDELELSEGEFNPLDPFEAGARRMPGPDGSQLLLRRHQTRDEATGDRSSFLVATDRHSGAVVGRVRLPNATALPKPGAHPYTGHFVTVAGVEGTRTGQRSRLAGISLLELAGNRPLWEIELEGKPRTGDIALPCTSGPDYALFFIKGRLLCIDPATGTMRWERLGFGPDVAIEHIFGDSDSLTVVHENKAEYTRLDTRTGETLQTGTLEAPVMYGQITHRHLLVTYVHDPGNEQSLLHFWNAETGETVLKLKCGTRPRYYPLGHLLLAGTKEGDFVLYDMERQTIRQRLDLLSLIPEEERGTFAEGGIRMWEDSGQLFVNLYGTAREQNPFRRVDSGVGEFYLSSMPMGAVNVKGWIFAVDPETYEVRWQRRMNQRTIMTSGLQRWPVMLAFARTRTESGREDVYVEVLDPNTGEPLTEPRPYTDREKWVLKFSPDTKIVRPALVPVPIVRPVYVTFAPTQRRLTVHLRNPPPSRGQASESSLRTPKRGQLHFDFPLPANSFSQP